MVDILRYIGIGKEAVYGTEVAAQFHIDPASISLDSPSDPNIKVPGGMGRMPGCFVPGAYSISGGLNFPATLETLYYILWLALGDKATTPAVTPVAAEAIGSTNSSGYLAGTLANGSVIPGTVKISDSNPTQVLEDNGAGVLVEVGASGASGIIDYVTGDFVIKNSTVSDAHTADYDYGSYEHVITPTAGVTPPSFTALCGKDVFEHAFLGCVINSFGMTVERELLDITLDVLGQKDKNNTIAAIGDLLLAPSCAIPFHQIVLKQADYGSALSDISANVDSLSLNIVNNSSVEDGIGLGNRFPQKAFTGEIDVNGEISLDFESLDYLQDFWGNAAGPSDTPQYKTFQVVITTALGDMTFDLYNSIFQQVSIQPSGRDRLKQSLTFAMKWDRLENQLMQVTANTVTNYT